MKANKIIALVAFSVLGLAGILFLVTTSLYKKPRGMEISFPDRSIIQCGGTFPQGCMKNEITIILSKDKRIFYYEGAISDYNNISLVAFIPPGSKQDTTIHEKEVEITIRETSFSSENGIEDVLEQHNSVAAQALEELEKQSKTEDMADSTYEKRLLSINLKFSAVTVYIKTDEGPKYGEVVKLIDLLKLKKISKFSLEYITPKELKLIRKALNKTPNQPTP